MAAVDRIRDEAVRELAVARALDPLRAEAIAEEVAARIEGVEPEHVAEAYECAYAHIPLPAGWWGHHLPGLIFVTTALADVETQRLVASHEGSHGTLRGRAEGKHHEHGDVWAIALAVLMPRARVKPLLERGARAVAAHFKVPLWAARVRLAMVAAIEGDAAHGCSQIIQLR